MTDAASLMGPLLLKGWAMTAESCEECGVPLMKDKKLNASLCCSCEQRLAKLVVDGSKIVADGPLYLVENASKSIQFRVRKEDGLLKFAGEVETVEEAPAQPAPIEQKQQPEESKQAEQVVAQVQQVKQPQEEVALAKQKTPGGAQPQQLPVVQLSESQKKVLSQLEKKQEMLALALDSVNDLDAIKQLVDIIAGIQTAINLIQKPT